MCIQFEVVIVHAPNISYLYSPPNFVNNNQYCEAESVNAPTNGAAVFKAGMGCIDAFVAWLLLLNVTIITYYEKHYKH